MNATLVRDALAFARRPAIKRGLRLAALAAIILLVGRALWQNWGAIAHHPWQIAPWPLALGFVLLVGQELSYGYIWQLTLRRLGYQLPWQTCLRIYLTAEFVRYIPGNVWHVVARVQMAEGEGVPRAQGFASMTIELATKIVAAALVFAISLFWWGDLTHLGGALGRFGGVALGVLGVPLLLLGLHPRILERGLSLMTRLLKRPPVTLALTYGDILTLTAAWMGSWLVAGLGFWLVVRGITADPLMAASVPLAVGISALGWDIGFLSFITPSGLGFREGAVAALLALSGIIPDLAVAGLVAITAARLLPTLAEILCVGGAYLARPWEARPPVAPES